MPEKAENQAILFFWPGGAPRTSTRPTPQAFWRGRRDKIPGCGGRTSAAVRMAGRKATGRQTQLKDEQWCSKKVGGFILNHPVFRYPISFQTEKLFK